MYKILTLNNISVSGLERLPRDQYEVASEIQHPDAILLRSFKMHDMDIPATLKAVGRAGAGVNNIPVDKMTQHGIPVFNAPGANSNAVKELVVAGMLLASRNICQAWDYTNKLEGDDAGLSKQVEAGKKKFAGFELPGRTLGVIGLGAIGIRVANVALSLGMKVIGYDPQITVKGAWQLAADVEQTHSVDDMVSRCDFITFHVPLIDATRNMLSAERIAMMKEGAVVLNFARDGIVDEEAVCKALDADKLYAYITDFPSSSLEGQKGVVALPHLGASTAEAEDNCAIMVADQIKEFLNNGNIVNSVNFPEVVMPRTNNSAGRLAIANSNVPNMVGQISTALADAGLNIIDMLNKSKADVAYTLVDVEGAVSDAVVESIKSIDGVLSVRAL